MKLSRIMALCLFGSIHLGIMRTTLAQPKENKLNYPLAASKKVLRGFDESYRQGIILNAKKGEAVKAVKNGTIVYWSKAVGLHQPQDSGIVIIDHGDGLISRYTNLRNLSVGLGEIVKTGEEIGILNKDYTFFSLINNSISVNPLQYFEN